MLGKIKELFEYRELIKSFVIRNLKVRYKGSVLGFMWTWLDPLITMFIFIFVFGIILRIKTENFPVYLLTGLLPWLFFSKSITGSVNSVVANANLIKSTYFPRSICPLSVVLSNFVNLLLSLIVLLPIIVLFKLTITYKVLLLFFPIILIFLFAFGLSLLFSCLNVYYRDMGYIIGFIVRLWFYANPIFYSASGRVPERFMDFYLLNPMAVILMLFRTTLMGLPSPSIRSIVMATFICIVTFIAGFWLFLDKEDKIVKRV